VLRSPEEKAKNEKKKADKKELASMKKRLEELKK
jgi:hypothetical protein